MMPIAPETLRRTGGRQLRSVVFDAKQIADRVGRLGLDITSAFPEGELMVLGLLKGSFIFMGDLPAPQYNMPLQVDFVVASWYLAGTRSRAAMFSCSTNPETELEGKHLLLVVLPRLVRCAYCSSGL